jgi:hypothetical protein
MSIFDNRVWRDAVARRWDEYPPATKRALHAMARQYEEEQARKAEARAAISAGERAATDRRIADLEEKIVNLQRSQGGQVRSGRPRGS